jgi:hypothetical protein
MDCQVSKSGAFSWKIEIQKYIMNAVFPLYRMCSSPLCFISRQKSVLYAIPLDDKLTTCLM